MLEKIICDAGPLVTKADPTTLMHTAIRIEDEETLRALGIVLSGRHRPEIYVTSRTQRIDSSIECVAPGSKLYLNNAAGRSNLIHLRIHGENSNIVFLGLTDQFVRIEVFLRSDNQTLLWGAGASCVGGIFELEGANRKLFIGDDCMFSTGIAVRNYDMHTMFEVSSNKIINPPPCDISIQRHVWMCQNSSIISAPEIGYGSIIAASSFVKEPVAPLSLVGGLPARLLRSGVSWCRRVNGVSADTIELISELKSLHQQQCVTMAAGRCGA